MDTLSTVSVRDNDPLKYRNFAYVMFMLYCQMLLNIQLNWIKRMSSLGIKCKGHKDGSRLQFIKFDFMSGGPEITMAIFLVKL